MSDVGQKTPWFSAPLRWARRVLVGTTQAKRPAPPASRRSYASARPSRFNVGLGAAGDSSADAELGLSLSRLRASSRQMVRDAPYAKRAKVIVVNNVVGGGVGMQAQVKKNDGDLFKRVNDDIESAWCEWTCADSCHTGGAMNFADLERAALGQVFEAGEVLIRKHYRKFGNSKVPLALEFIEAERLASDLSHPLPLSAGAEVRMGVEVDKFGRALAYFFRTRHPGDAGRAYDPAMWERVPADEVFHLRVVDRWPQTRGEPWMHTVIRKLDSINDYSGAELQAAQADAYHFGTIHTSAPAAGAGGALADNLQAQDAYGDKPVVSIENGMVQELEPGEEFDYHKPSRPNTALDPFLRYMLREVAAGIGVSYESISRDYSQSNYSSSRLALLEDRDLWRVLQAWWLRNFRMPLHKAWMQQAVLSGAISSIPLEQYMPSREKFEAVKFKPRGWSWVDPTKEVAAYKEAEKAGYISAEDIIAQTANGLDIEDVVEAIKRSRELYEDAGIARDTDVRTPAPAAAAPGAPGAAPGAPPEDPEDAGDGKSDTTDDPPSRVVSFQR